MVFSLCLNAQEVNCPDFESYFKAEDYENAILALLDCKKNENLTEKEKTSIDFYLQFTYSIINDYEDFNPILFEEIIEAESFKYDSRILLYANHILAQYYLRNSNIEKVIKFEEKIMNIRKQILGENHPDYATSLSNLALIYYDLGDYQKSIELNQQALIIYKQILGENHPNYATSLSNLASNYSDLGDYQKSIELNQQALSIR